MFRDRHSAVAHSRRKSSKEIFQFDSSHHIILKIIYLRKKQTKDETKSLNRFIPTEPTIYRKKTTKHFLKKLNNKKVPSGC